MILFWERLDSLQGVGTESAAREVFADWRQAARRGKAHGSVEVILKQLEPKTEGRRHMSATNAPYVSI